MWVSRKSFLVSMSAMYLNFNRRKAHLETVLHALLVCESQQSWYLKDVVLTLDQFSPRLKRDRIGVSKGWQVVFLSGRDCHTLGLDQIDGTILSFWSSDAKMFFSMYKLKTDVSESIMYDNVRSWLLIPSRPDYVLLSSLDMYLPSSETERYGMTNGSCPLVFFFFFLSAEIM